MPRIPHLGDTPTNILAKNQIPRRSLARPLGTRSATTGPMANPVWLSTGDTAEQLGISVRFLYRLIDEGHIPAYRIGRVVRLMQPDVDDFVAASRIEPGSIEHLVTGEVRERGSDDAGRYRR